MLFVAACSPRVNLPADAGGSASTTSTAYPAASAPGSTAYPTVGEVFPTATQELPTVTQPPTASPPAPAQENVADFPDPRAFIWQTVVSGLERPTDLADAGEGRLLVLEQPGRVRLVLDGGLQADPFLDITDRVGAQGNEQGLLGIAFHPRFAENGFFYLVDRKDDMIITSGFNVYPRTGFITANMGVVGIKSQYLV
uniref:Glucose/Sorbosone dehydrogenase domain-containing protein n=1 Tax=Anaerolinea thermolimosa TaxID=229919 RepID=A0A7C4KHE4_9CHLR